MSRAPLSGDHAVARRPADVVMRLARMGSAHPTRLSFMRILTRRMADEAWTFSCPVFDIDAAGVGHAVYVVETPHRRYGLVAFAHDLPDEARSDRVIAEAWDATFTLVDGVPDAQDIARLADQVPLQEAGRISETELTLARANRSARVWDHVVRALAAGRQPDAAELDAVGYLMRTTAVYGSGKFGAADRDRIAARDEMQAPFQAEMLTVYLIRVFVRDLVEHMARMRGGAAAVGLDPGLARRIGIGNSTGLGMAPFIVNHPVLFNNWIAAREEALARVRGLARASDAKIARFHRARAGAERIVAGWTTTHPIQIEKCADLARDLAALEAHFASGDAALDASVPWDRLYRWGEAHLSVEGQELLAALMIEPHGELVDGLAHCMSDPGTDRRPIDGAMPVGVLRDLLARDYDWALAIDWAAPEAIARAWYVSAEKLEPRLGERALEPIEAYEHPLAPGRDAAALYWALADWPDTDPVARLLLSAPEHRQAVRRAQLTAKAPYAEIRDNTIDAGMLPIDMLRAKLSFFGATRFDPRSDRWVRITMYANAPYPEDLTPEAADDWIYPQVPPGAGAGEGSGGGAGRGAVSAPMDMSLNEIEAELRKAVRGVGLSWGLAEDTARAVRWLEARGLPGIGVLADVLDGGMGGCAPLAGAQNWQPSLGGPLCPCRTGAALADHLGLIGPAPLAIAPVRAPLLIVGFAARALAHRGAGCIGIYWGSGHVETDGLAIAAHGDMATTAPHALTVIQSAHGPRDTHPRRTRARPDPVLWARIKTHAARTLAPATDASRAGAGAGAAGPEID